jgi:hypothetical protein
MLAFIWDKIPNYIKWPLSFAFFLFLVPLKIRDEVTGFIHKEVHAVIIPMKERRDMELLQMKSDLATIKQDTRDIKLILMESRNATR